MKSLDRGLLWGLLLAVPPSLSVGADADLWWHLLAGQRILRDGHLPVVDDWSYTAAGNPWIDHEWLPELLTTFAWNSLGNPGLLVLHAIFLVTLVGAWMLVARDRIPNNPVVWLIVGLPLPLLAVLCNLRPQTITWMMVPVVLWLVDRVANGRNWAPWVLVAAVWLWSNTHGGFLFGWGLAGLGLLLTSAGLEGARPTTSQRIVRLVAAGLVAISPLLNPYGTELLTYIWAELTAAHPNLPEWNPPNALMWGVLLLTVVPPPLLWLVHRARVRPTAWVGLFIATLAATQSAKFVALAMLLGAVCLAEALAPLLRSALQRDDGDELNKLLTSLPFRIGTLALLLVLHVPFRAGLPGTVPIDTEMYPVQAIEWLNQTHSGGRLALQLGWGGLALYHLSPSWTVSMDGRNTTVYPVAQVDEHSRAFSEGDVSALLIERPDAFVVRTDSPMDHALDDLIDWDRRFEGPTGTVYVHKDHNANVPAFRPRVDHEFP